MNHIVYILTNEAMPGYVKIGKTTSTIEERMRQLSSATGVPLAFTCFYACRVKDCHEVERALHDAFGDVRVNQKREFFKITPNRIVSILRLLALSEVTPNQEITDTEEERIALETVQKRRPPFRFDMLNIPIGAELTFYGRDDVRATVIDNRKIQYNDMEYSPSQAAAIVLGYTYWPAGTYYWMYENETLDERRYRLENENTPI